MNWLTPEVINSALFVAIVGALAAGVVDVVREALGRRADRRTQKMQRDKALTNEPKASQASRIEEHQRWKRDQCVKAYLEYRQLLEQFILQERSPAVFGKDVPLLTSIRNTEAALQFLMPALNPPPGEITTKVLSFRDITDERVLDAATAQVRRDLIRLDQAVQSDLDTIAAVAD